MYVFSFSHSCCWSKLSDKLQKKHVPQIPDLDPHHHYPVIYSSCHAVLQSYLRHLLDRVHEVPSPQHSNSFVSQEFYPKTVFARIIEQKKERKEIFNQ